MPWTIVPPGTLRALTNGTLAALLRGDTPTPRFFMSGDGHRHPPFGWTEACSELIVYFQQLILADRLCLHVEEQQSSVAHGSVPERLMGLVDRNRVFGWEWAVFDALGPALEVCNQLRANDNYQPTAQVYELAVELDKEITRAHAMLWQLGQPPALTAGRDISWRYRHYCQRYLPPRTPLDVGPRAARNMALEAQYRTMVINYSTAVMQMRLDGNPFIGRKIQTVIDQFPDSTHLITCGHAHINHNPLQQYVRIPAEAIGIVDAGPG